MEQVLLGKRQGESGKRVCSTWGMESWQGEHSSKVGNYAQEMLVMCLGCVHLHKPEKSWDTNPGCDQQAKVLQLQDLSVWV